MSHNERLAHIMEIFGVPRGGHFPPEGMARRTVQVSLAGDALRFAAWISPEPNGGNRHRSHRVRCVCPNCGTELSAGRIHQHYGTLRCLSQKMKHHHVRPTDAVNNDYTKRPWREPNR